MKNTPPTRANVIVLKQMLNLIPRGMINRHALETGVEAKVRTFGVLIQLSAMLFAQLSHAIGLAMFVTGCASGLVYWLASGSM